MNAAGLRRRIEIASRVGLGEEGEARAALEDDFHHFRVWVRHRDGLVTATGAEAPRHPYTTCPLAAGRLEELIGMPLIPASGAVFRWTDARLQCTHMLDLAGLAIAASARGDGRRRYDAEVPDRIGGHTSARLLCDGQPALAWDVHDDHIVAPPPFDGLALGTGFARWIQENLAPDQAEAALVLRRCVMISRGRGVDLDAQRNAEPLGRCFSQQPERAPSALRVRHSTQDFSNTAGRLCQEDDAWINFCI